MRSEFLYFVCNPGSERALKSEVARAELGWTSAYARPGFVTMKAQAPVDAALEADFVFARAYGLSFGKVASTELQGRVEALAKEAAGPVVCRAIPRSEDLGPLAGELDVQLRSATPQNSAAPERTVIDLSVVSPVEWWIGARKVKGPLRPVAPGIAAPEKAPSRAYLKLHEVLLWSGLEPKRGERAVEVGVSPGGAAYYLLERGLEVTGIDPATVDPALVKHRGFHHIMRSFSLLEPDELPRSFEWLLVDINAAPPVALKAVDMLTKKAAGLRGLILTLKLKDAKAEDALPHALKDLEALGFRNPRAAQLSSHRKEVAVVATT